MNVAEIIGHQHLRILALEETIGARELEISLLKEKVMKLTPAIGPVTSASEHIDCPCWQTGVFKRVEGCKDHPYDL